MLYDVYVFNISNHLYTYVHCVHMMAIIIQLDIFNFAEYENWEFFELLFMQKEITK